MQRHPVIGESTTTWRLVQEPLLPEQSPHMRFSRRTVLWWRPAGAKRAWQSSRASKSQRHAQQKGAVSRPWDRTPHV